MINLVQALVLAGSTSTLMHCIIGVPNYEPVNSTISGIFQVGEGSSFIIFLHHSREDSHWQSA